MARLSAAADFAFGADCSKEPVASDGSRGSTEKRGEAGAGAFGRLVVIPTRFRVRAPAAIPRSGAGLFERSPSQATGAEVRPESGERPEPGRSFEARFPRSPPESPDPNPRSGAGRDRAPNTEYDPSTIHPQASARLRAGQTSNDKTLT